MSLVAEVAVRDRRSSFDRQPATSSLASQLALVLAAALLYFLVRGLTESVDGTPMANARRLLELEAWLGIDVEAGLQQLIIDRGWLVTASNWIYIWGHWPVIVATLVWFHRTDAEAYVGLRNAMFASGAIGLVCFAAFPVAPPRLYDPIYVDTVTELSSSYRVLQPPALVNKYAAMPSLHVGWNFLVGVFLVRRSSTRWMRRLGVASPVLMSAAVVLTANHYVVDAVAGVVVATAGLAIAGALAVTMSRIDDGRAAPRGWVERILPARPTGGEATRSAPPRRRRRTPGDVVTGVLTGGSSPRKT